MNFSAYPPIVWILILAVGAYLAWWLTRSTGGRIPAGGLNNGKS